MSIHDIPHRYGPGDPVKVTIGNRPAFYGVVTFVNKYIDPDTGHPEPLYTVRKTNDTPGELLPVPRLPTAWSVGEHRMSPADGFDWTAVNRELFHPVELNVLAQEHLTQLYEEI